MLKVVNTAFNDAIESVEPRVHHFFSTLTDMPGKSSRR
jgi:hypothetical protein